MYNKYKINYFFYYNFIRFYYDFIINKLNLLYFFCPNNQIVYSTESGPAYFLVHSLAFLSNSSRLFLYSEA